MRSVIRLLQLSHPGHGRRIALPSDTTLSVLSGFGTAYDAAEAAFTRGVPFPELLQSLPVEQTLDYDDVYRDDTDWIVLPPFDQPHEPSRCLISGTGLTHLASAETRQKMHAELEEKKVEQETDSMRMYRWGVEGGRPPAGSIGAAPEWFYKGTGLILRAHGQPLEVHRFAEDGGEEPEIAGVYMIDGAGQPRRIGMTQGNEFSDHKTERRNYLYLAASKLRQCSTGPELIVDPAFESAIPGVVKIERDGQTLWSKEIATGGERMSHTLANMEHHHFKFPEHRRSGDVHIHFFGAGAFSFGAGIELNDGDIAEISFAGFGRPLRNPIQVDKRVQELVAVLPA